MTATTPTTDAATAWTVIESRLQRAIADTTAEVQRICAVYVDDNERDDTIAAADRAAHRAHVAETVAPDAPETAVLRAAADRDGRDL